MRKKTKYLIAKALGKRVKRIEEHIGIEVIELDVFFYSNCEFIQHKTKNYVQEKLKVFGYV